MFSPEYTEVDSTRFSLDIETFSNHLEYGKVDLQVSSLHNSGAFFFFFLSLCSLAGCPECPCTPPTPKPADACRDVATGGKRRLASSHRIHKSAPTPASGREVGARTLFTTPSAEMQNHFCDSFSIIMKGD